MHSSYLRSVGNLQLLSTGLGVQVLVVVSGLGPHIPHDNGGDHDVEHLVFDSSKRVEHGVVGSAFQRLGGVRRHGVRGDVLLGGGTQGSPPAQVCLWCNSSHVCVVNECAIKWFSRFFRLY